MSDERELKKLQDAFPGIWVREDGAFRYEPFGMYWEPGDVESDLSYEEGMIRAPNSDGRVLIRGDDYGRGEAKLKLSQIQALADYITAIDSSLAAARIRAKREAGEAAIAALSPAVVSGAVPVSFAHQQPERFRYHVRSLFSNGRLKSSFHESLDEAETEYESIRIDPLLVSVTLEDVPDPASVTLLRQHRPDLSRATSEVLGYLVSDNGKVAEIGASAQEIPEGFTLWRGTAREGPIYDVIGSAPVEALLRDGRRETSSRYDFDWSVTGSPDDIIAYRVVSGDP